jgi:hypothetical protein
MASIDITDFYREVLDELYPEVTVAGQTWNASRVLEELDPISFQIGVEEYKDNQIEAGNWFEWEDGEIYDEEEEDEEEPCDICGLDH